MFGWLRSKTATEIMGQRVAISSDAVRIKQLEEKLSAVEKKCADLHAQYASLASCDDQRVAKLEAKLAASEKKYADLHAQYATLFELNQMQARRIEYLQGELAGVTGEPG